MSRPERQYAPPVARDAFSCYGSNFYVEVEGHRHERTDSKTLHGFLTYTGPPPPVLTKAGYIAKRQPTPHKDPPGHFYCAQLLHYGLKPMKTKAAAKKQLLAAFAANRTLAVPEKILKLEETLLKEYGKANEIAKKKYEEDKARRKVDEERKRKKRKRDNDAIMQEFIDAEHLEGLGESESTTNEVSQVQLRDAIATLPEKDLRKILAKLVEEIPALEHAVMMEVGKLKLSGDAGPHKPKTSKTATKATKGRGNGNGKGKEKSRELDIQELEGVFEIVAPYLCEEWPDYTTETMTLEISPSSTSSHLWASFDFGIVSGIIRSSSRPPSITGASCPFFWRGRESGEGQMSFGKHNTGSITFLGNGKIKGRMEWMGGFEFVGKKENGENSVWSGGVRVWKSEWRGFNESSYERENVGRWGRGSTWGWRDDAEKPSSSDTSALGSDSAEEGGYGSEDFESMPFY